MCGASPKYMSLGFIIEEGFTMNEFWEVLVSIKNAADKANVKIVTGDTKVVEKGKGDKIFINTSGIGLIHPKANIHHNNIEEGDVVLIGTGWTKNWGNKDLFQGQSLGTPGIGEAGAKWLAAKKPRACGGETIAFEHIPAGAGHRELPVHRVFLVESGIHIIETMKLDELADTGESEFLFVLTPLNLQGATGSPTRPLAVLV